VRVIETQALTCSVAGRTLLSEASFAVAPGSVVGVIGDRAESGAALLRALAGLLSPTAGDAWVDGFSVTQQPREVRRLVGYVPGDPPTIPDITPREHILLFAAGHGVPRKEQAALLENLLALFELSHLADRPLAALSRGARRRVELARALAHDPPLLLLEDPFADLDPRAHVELRALIRELNELGKTILIASSCALDLDGLCTHLLTLSQGRVTQCAPIADAALEAAPFARALLVQFLGDPVFAKEMARAQAGVREVVLHDAGAGVMPAGMTTLKQMRVRFDGTYQQAVNLMRVLMHTNVQMVFFGEER